MKSPLKFFSQYLREQAEQSEGLDRPLKGYNADQLISRIEELMEILSDDVRFGVPSDTLGRATTYRDANGAIQKIKDMLHYYDSKGEEVRFYCWSISYNGSWKATKNLKKKIEEAGGFGESDLNMNLKKVVDYFTQNPEDSDNVRSISISMDAMSIRKATGKATEPEKEEPTEKQAEEGTEGQVG
jgi:hypothetical protein